jgi:putative heme-binding domain-containing protein
MLRLMIFGMMIVPLLGSTTDAQDSKEKDKQEKTEKKNRQKAPPKKRDVAPPETLQTLPGFKVELLQVSEPAAEGSWINLAKDNKGRLIIGGQRNQSTLRFTLKDGKVDSVEKLELPVTEVMGILYAFDSLYVNGAGPQGFGLYRCRDTKGDGQYDNVQFLKRFEGAGEHGPHGIALGPDNHLYIMNGNHTKVPEGMSPESPHRNYQEDLLLPRQWDAGGHAVGILSPGGYVVRTDADGKKWDFVLGGFRNAYDFAFNGDGELFTYDSDMEWDWGMPWYRPTRINHCTSGAEFGWRSGSGVWPDYYPDSLPTTLDIGIGSPTGVTVGTGAKFPAKYQKAFYILDWTYGRIIAVHLTPKGSSYTGEYENFLAPVGLTEIGPKKPLNVTDAIIGDDGAMYFTIGGRNTQAALYRISYTGSESTEPAKLTNEAGAKERNLRHELEAFHGKQNAKAIETAWPYLNSDDRFLRYAARIAIESQSPEEWKSRALSESQPTAALTALLALARTSDSKTQPELLAALEKFPLAKLTEEQQLAKLRIMGVSCIRQGRPNLEPTKKILAELEAQFPNTNEKLNREIVQILISLHSSVVVERSLKLMREAKTQEDLLHYLFHLRTLPIGFWTLPQRQEYFAYFKDRKKLDHPPELMRWFAEAGRAYSDGASFQKFLVNFFREATANLSAQERTALKSQLESIDKASVKTYDIPSRPVVKEWKMDEILDKLDLVEKGRSFSKGQQAYIAGQCVKCHRFDTDGGAVGPELTAISSRFGRKELLESILEPSKVISDQYENIVIVTKSGKQVTGRLMDETKDKLILQPDPLSPERVEVEKDDIERRRPSKVSPMPDHLVDVLSEEEILDLLAYLESAGRKDYKAFRK